MCWNIPNIEKENFESSVFARFVCIKLLNCEQRNKNLQVGVAILLPTSTPLPMTHTIQKNFRNITSYYYVLSLVFFVRHTFVQIFISFWSFYAHAFVFSYTNNEYELRYVSQAIVNKSTATVTNWIMYTSLINHL